MLRPETRSSAQGNCSAKSLLASVMSSILPCLSILPGPPCLLPIMQGGVSCGGVRQGRGLGEGRGQGIFHPPCHILHHHMVLRPKGTSQNKYV